MVKCIKIKPKETKKNGKKPQQGLNPGPQGFLLDALPVELCCLFVITTLLLVNNGKMTKKHWINRPNGPTGFERTRRKKKKKRKTLMCMLGRSLCCPGKGQKN